jgi:hypothetical protein
MQQIKSHNSLYCLLLIVFLEQVFYFIITIITKNKAHKFQFKTCNSLYF